MAKVKVDLGGLRELKKQIRNIPKLKAKEVDAEIKDAMEIMVRNAKTDAPKDHGGSGLEGGITYDRGSAPLLDWVMSSNVFYSVYMEFGTKRRYQPIPGVDPSEFKATGEGKTGKGFYDSILEWVKRKGFAAEKTKSGKASKSLSSQIAQEQAAFTIYLSIIRHGVKPHPFFFKQLDIVKPKLIKNIQSVLNG